MNDSEFLSNALWSDLKTDMERANWLLLGRGYETGVVAKAIQNELAMAYSRLAFLSAAQPVAQPVVDQEPASMSDNGSCGSQVSGKPVSAEAGKGEWVSVAERMPDTEDEVLVFTAQGVVLDRWRMQSEAPLSFSSATTETGMYWDEHEFEEVTHWMPIPQAPKGARGSARPC